MGKNKRQKAITLMLAAIAGECAALLIIVIILVYTAPAGMTQKNNTAVDQLPADTSFFDTETVESPTFDIEAEVLLTDTKMTIKEYIRLKPAPENSAIYLPSSNKAVTAVKSVTHNGKPVVYDRKGSNITLIQPQNNSILFIEYEVILGTKPEILSYSKDRVLLTNFLAVPAVYRNSSPIPIYTSSLGDPYRYDIYSYKLRIKADKGYIAYGPGKKSDIVINETRVTEFEADKLRDFPLVLYRNASIVTQRQGNTDITLINAGSARNYAAYALKYAQDLIGPYPYKEFFVVKADFPLSGMEFSNMVFISETCFNDNNVLKRVLYHEVFHQWFYGIIATDQLNEPFMDEGMVTYLTSRMCGDKLSSAYDSRFMHMNLTQYNSKATYNKLAYVDAAAYFGELHRKMGNNFNSMLKKIYNDKKFKTLYFDDFKQYLTEFSRRN